MTVRANPLYIEYVRSNVLPNSYRRICLGSYRVSVVSPEVIRRYMDAHDRHHTGICGALKEAHALRRHVRTSREHARGVRDE